MIGLKCKARSAGAGLLVAAALNLALPAAQAQEAGKRGSGETPWASPAPIHLGEVGRPILGSFYGSAGDYGPDAALMGGSIYQDGWVVAHMHSETGKSYVVYLGHTRDGAATVTISTASGAGGVLAPDPRTPPIPKRPVDYWHQPQGDLVRYTSSAVATAGFIDIGFNDREISYRIGGVVDLKGHAVTPGIFRYLPWRRGHLSGVQISSGQNYLSSGVIFGEKVTGFLHAERNMDRVPWNEGPMAHELHGFQSLWITVFADGTSEHGGLWCGRTGLRGAVIVDNLGRELVNTDNVSVTVGWAPGALITSADMTIAGQAWRYEARPNGIPMAETVKPDPQPAEASGLTGTSFTNALDGLMLRKGETRKVVAYWANAEADPNRPCGPAAAPAHP